MTPVVLGNILVIFGPDWGAVAVTEDKFSSLTHCLVLVPLIKKKGPTESGCLEPMVIFWT